MKSAFRALLAAAILLTWNITPSVRAQSGQTPKLTQAPVPANTAPLPSKDQPYVYRKVNDKLYVIAEIHQPFPKNEATNPPHTQQMGLVIGNQRAALIDTGLGLTDLRKLHSLRDQDCLRAWQQADRPERR